MDQYKDTRGVLEAGAQSQRESTLLPMLLGGLVLIVIAAGVVMTVV